MIVSMSRVVMVSRGRGLRRQTTSHPPSGFPTITDHTPHQAGAAICYKWSVLVLVILVITPLLVSATSSLCPHPLPARKQAQMWLQGELCVMCYVSWQAQVWLQGESKDSDKYVKYRRFEQKMSKLVNLSCQIYHFQLFFAQNAYFSILNLSILRKSRHP